MTRPRSQFFPDIGHIHLQLFNAAGISLSPDAPDYRRISQNLAWRFRQQRDNIILCMRQMNLLTAYADFSLFIIDLDIFD